MVRILTQARIKELLSFDRRRGKWFAKIQVYGENVFLGRHHTVEEAHAAYCKASPELHKEFGRTK